MKRSKMSTVSIDFVESSGYTDRVRSHHQECGGNSMPASATVERMGKKKKDTGEKADGGKQSPRRTISLPLAWFEVAEKLAKKGPTPVVWYVVKLIEADARTA